MRIEQKESHERKGKKRLCFAVVTTYYIEPRGKRIDLDNFIHY